MAEETICVVGCSGFVGSHVTAELLSRGYSVNGTLREASGPKAGWLTEQLAPEAKPERKLTLFSAELGDKAFVNRRMRYIHHL